jgi:hypothetical protein
MKQTCGAWSSANWVADHSSQLNSSLPSIQTAISAMSGSMRVMSENAPPDIRSAMKREAKTLTDITEKVQAASSADEARRATFASMQSEQFIKDDAAIQTWGKKHCG